MTGTTTIHTLRYYDRDRDYPMLESWWRGHNMEPLAPAVLPKVGIVVVNGDAPLCVGFLYQTDSAICHVEWFLRNPVAPKELMVGAIEALIESLCLTARELGFRVAYMAVKNESLIRKAKACGFVVHEDRTLTHMLRHFRE